MALIFRHVIKIMLKTLPLNNQEGILHLFDLHKNAYKKHKYPHTDMALCHESLIIISSQH